jgi:protoheme IX farnesyltransferase
MIPGEALGFGAVLGVGSVLMMGLAVNWVAAELLALTIGFYVFIYTIWLKRRTPQNIVIGGAAGAFPPMIGWAAVTGDIGWGAIALFAIIFFWTPPHFWALSLYRAGDYAAAGVPMLPVVAGPRETKRQMLLYTLVLCPVSLTPWLLGVAGILYAALALLLSIAFTGSAIRVRRDESDRSARQMFAFSLLYLFLIFCLLLVDRVGEGWL